MEMEDKNSLEDRYKIQIRKRNKKKEKKRKQTKQIIHGFHNSTVVLKTRDYSKFSCLFT